MTNWNPIRVVRHVARNSPWVLIAVAIHMVVLASAAIFYTASRDVKTADDGITIRTSPPKVAVEEPPEVREVFERKPLDMTEEIELVATPEDWKVSDADTTVEIAGELSADTSLPLGDQGSTSIGAGDKGMRGLGQGPAGPRRGSPPLGDGPGRKNKETEEAVMYGLCWLARHQNADGSWGLASSKAHCASDVLCFDEKARYTTNYDEGLTGLALLAYLGAGFSAESKPFFTDPVSKKRVTPSVVVKQGLRWLVEHQNPDGSFSRGRPFMYTEALATMALCEAYGLTHQRYFREPAQRAIDFLQAAQRPNPSGQGRWGWRYASRQEVERFHQGDTLDESFKRELYDADTSVTGWCVMALKSARSAGLEVQPEALDGGLAFCKWVTANDGLVGYLDPKSAGATVSGPGDQFVYHPGTMSALGMCIRTFTEHDPDDPALEPAAKRLAADLPRVSKDQLSIDYYYWYYGALALNQYDGPDSPRKNGKLWLSWNKAMVAALLPLQSLDSRSCNHGGWLVPDRWCHAGGPLYATAINVLTLEVYYRFPNAFGTGRKDQTSGAAPATTRK